LDGVLFALAKGISIIGGEVRRERGSFGDCFSPSNQQRARCNPVEFLGEIQVPSRTSRCLEHPVIAGGLRASHLAKYYAMGQWVKTYCHSVKSRQWEISLQVELQLAGKII
jgi:hypothetical protein